MRYWRTASGSKRNIKKIGQQYLSNILWYKEIMSRRNADNDWTYFYLEQQLEERYKGRRMRWKPKPIPNEIKDLYRMGLISKDGWIVYCGEIIGSVKHIEDYEKYKM